MPVRKPRTALHAMHCHGRNLYDLSLSGEETHHPDVLGTPSEPGAMETPSLQKLHGDESPLREESVQSIAGTSCICIYWQIFNR